MVNTKVIIARTRIELYYENPGYVDPKALSLA